LKEEGKISEAYSKATQSSRLTGDMIEEAQKLLEAMGIPYIVAESEGEAEAAYMTAQDQVYAVGSQDWDCLLFGADTMVRNLTSRKTRKTSGGGRKEVSTEKIVLEDVLDQLGITHEELQWLGILVGTDFNPDGIYGIGPKTALDLVKQYNNFEDLMSDEKVEWESDNSPEAILEFFQDPPVEDVDFEFKSPDNDKIRTLLVEEHEFSQKRVDSGLEKLSTALESRQSGLDSFT